ncbi:MAG TPA: hypothetical protein VGH70_03975 [Bradyrhizobium sp.]
MFTSHSPRRIAAVVAALLLTLQAAFAAPVGRPVAGQQVRFPNGTWSALPQTGPDGKVRQCVLVTLRQRTGSNGPVDTRFSINISRGTGLAIMIQDDGLPSEQVLDDQAELSIEGRTFPAVFFPIGTALVFHPGDAEGALAALGKAKELRLHSDGAGVDSGAIKIDLAPEALNWLKQCGKTFNVAIDKPTDPNAPDLPTPRPRSPKIAFIPAAPVGPPGMADKQKIEGWDASELRNNDGSIVACMIRRHYVTGSEPDARRLATFFMASHAKGLTMMLKDFIRHGTEGEAVEASLKMDDKSFPPFTAAVLGPDEVGITPQHGAALAAALENGGRATFKTGTDYQLEFPIQAGVIPWLRACARRNGIPIEHGAQ